MSLRAFQAPRKGMGANIDGSEKCGKNSIMKGEDNMKVKKTLATVVILIGLLGVFAPGASAGWHYCTVNYLGMGYDIVYVNLTDTATPAAFTTRWFKIEPSNWQKQLLAVALTAVSTDMVAYVYLDTETEYSDLNVMYLYK
jgi:hypothetical protein